MEMSESASSQAGTGPISVANTGIEEGGRSRAINITSTGTVSGTANGISATHAGNGDITIAATSVTGIANNGIQAEISTNTATSEITIITTGAVIGGNNGIYAINAGTGEIRITLDGDVSGVGANGIMTFTRNSVLITVNPGVNRLWSRRNERYRNEQYDP